MRRASQAATERRALLTWSESDWNTSGTVTRSSACPYHLRHSGVAVVKPTEDWDGHDRTGRLDRTAERGIFRESEMGASAIVGIGVAHEDPAKVRLAQDHDMVQAFSPDRADEPLDVSVLPGRAGRIWSVPDVHGSKTPRYHTAIRSISVPNEVLGCLIPGESLSDLAAIQSAVGLAVTLIQKWPR
jgi:hypothetical protein